MARRTIQASTASIATGAAIRWSKRSAGWLAGDWELTIAQFARVKLIDDLGLRVVDGKVTSAFHFWSEFNFTAANGKVVWRGA